MNSPIPSDFVEGIVDRGWVLTHSPPPYVEEIPLPPPPLQQRRYSLLILDIGTYRDDAVSDLHELVRGLRRALTMPVFGRLDRMIANSDHLAFRDALAAAGGELLPPEQDIGRRAREVLTIRPNLASDWLRWYRLYRKIGPRQDEAVRALVNHASELSSVEEILRDAEMSPRSAQRWLVDGALPPPGAWVRASRVLRALLTLQRNPQLDIYDAAVETGYASSEAFSNAMFRYFRHGAPQGRRLLGLESRFYEFDSRIGQFPIMSGQRGR